MKPRRKTKRKTSPRFGMGEEGKPLPSAEPMARSIIDSHLDSCRDELARLRLIDSGDEPPQRGESTETRRILTETALAAEENLSSIASAIAKGDPWRAVLFTLRGLAASYRLTGTAPLYRWLESKRQEKRDANRDYGSRGGLATAETNRRKKTLPDVEELWRRVAARRPRDRRLPWWTRATDRVAADLNAEWAARTGATEKAPTITGRTLRTKLKEAGKAP